MGQANPIGGPGSATAGVILIVEDEPILRSITADTFRHAGYQVLKAATADEAVTVLLSGCPVDVVFSDVQLPGQMGGLSLTVWIRERFPGIKVILTSGAGPIVQALEAGEPVPFVPKPYDPDVVATQLLPALLSSSTKTPNP